MSSSDNKVIDISAALRQLAEQSDEQLDYRHKLWQWALDHAQNDMQDNELAQWVKDSEPKKEQA